VSKQPEKLVYLFVWS